MTVMQKPSGSQHVPLSRALLNVPTMADCLLLPFRQVANHKASLSHYCVHMLADYLAALCGLTASKHAISRLASWRFPSTSLSI